jgi:hypothetical protein
MCLIGTFGSRQVHLPPSNCSQGMGLRSLVVSRVWTRRTPTIPSFAPARLARFAEALLSSAPQCEFGGTPCAFVRSVTLPELMPEILRTGSGAPAGARVQEFGSKGGTALRRTAQGT